MIKHRFSMGLVALFAAMLAQVVPLPAVAQGISQKVAVCNPDFTARCIKPDTNGAVPVTGSLTPSGTQDTNLKQVAGASTATGHGTAAGTLRVELPTDGTGVVGLNAGTAIIGKAGIDQTTPGTTNGVVVNSSALPSGAATSALQSGVQGPVTAATATATSSMLGGCRYVSTLDTFTTGQQGALTCGSRGSLHVELWSSDSATALGVAGTNANGGAGTSTGILAVGAYQKTYNGSTWDLETGNQDSGSALVTLTAQAAGTVNSADQVNYNAKGVNVVIDITAATAMTLTVNIQVKDGASGKYVTVLSSTALAGTGTTLLQLYPGLTASANSVANAHLSRTWRISTTITGTSVTATVGASVLN